MGRVGLLRTLWWNKWVGATRGDTMANEELMDDHLPFDSSERSEVELIDHLFGFKAGMAGEPNDETRKLAWQRGWADARNGPKNACQVPKSLKP